MVYKRPMGAKKTQTQPKAEYSYAHVETALAATFGVDVTGKVGWLRGRIQHLRRLGLQPKGPGKGATIRYSLDDVDRWLAALELEHFRIHPTAAVAAVKNNWNGPGMLRDLVAEARASREPKNDVLITVDFGPLSTAPIISHTTLKAIGAFGAWLAGPGPCDTTGRRDRWSRRARVSPLKSLYPSKRLLAGRHCRQAGPGWPAGSRPRIPLFFEHQERTCTPAGRPRRSPVRGCASSANTGIDARCGGPEVCDARGGPEHGGRD